MFAGSAVLALIVRREWKRAAAVALVAGAIVIAGVAWMNARTGGWFSYYVLDMPRAHGITPSRASDFIGDLLRGFLLTGATALLAVRGIRQKQIFAFLLVGSFVASASSRMHIGGWANVTMFWSTFACAAIGAEGARLEKAQAVVANALVALQIVAFAYDPAACVPARSHAADNDKLAALVRDLERNGEVLVLGRGHVTSERHFHIAALIDVFLKEGMIPESVARPFRERRFAAIVIDHPDDLLVPVAPRVGSGFLQLVMARYYVARRMPIDLPPPVLGWKARPTYVLLPRQRPLDEEAKEALRARLAIEIGLVNARGDKEGGASVEDLARDASERL
jgi:hypothetical protein